MSELCHHAWVGDDECAYCKSEELEGLLSECMTRIAELEAARSRYQIRILELERAIQWYADRNNDKRSTEEILKAIRKEIK